MGKESIIRFPDCTRRIFPEGSVVSNLYTYSVENPEVFNAFIREFDDVICVMRDEEIPHTENTGNWVSMLHYIQDHNPGYELPMLEELFAPQDYDIQIPGILTLKWMKGEWETRWKWVEEIKEPEKQVAGLLVEGYGYHLARTHSYPSLQRAFVLAFEETLIAGTEDLTCNTLIQSIRPWIEEEVHDFDPEVVKKLGVVTPQTH